MKNWLLVLSAVLFLSACGDLIPQENKELSKKVEQIADAKNVHAIQVSDFATAITILDGKSFDLNRQDRNELALKVANLALEEKPDVMSVVVVMDEGKNGGLNATYAYENKNGKLVLVEED